MSPGLAITEPLSLQMSNLVTNMPFYTISTRVISCENIEVGKFQYLRGQSGVKDFWHPEGEILHFMEI